MLRIAGGGRRSEANKANEMFPGMADEEDDVPLDDDQIRVMAKERLEGRNNAADGYISPAEGATRDQADV